MTDLNAESEILPLIPPREDWLGHKGMVQAAEYIKKKLAEESLITKALNKVSPWSLLCVRLPLLKARIKFSFYRKLSHCKRSENHCEQRAKNNIDSQDPERGTHQFGLTLVGHSLGGGTAAILGILLRPEYPDVECFTYGPPGGLLSEPAQIYTQEFVTSVVVGKDVVPRIGLNQMESLRSDLMHAIKRSVDPKVF